MSKIWTNGLKAGLDRALIWQVKSGSPSKSSQYLRDTASERELGEPQAVRTESANLRMRSSRLMEERTLKATVEAKHMKAKITRAVTINHSVLEAVPHLMMRRKILKTSEITSRTWQDK